MQSGGKRQEQLVWKLSAGQSRGVVSSDISSVRILDDFCGCFSSATQARSPQTTSKNITALFFVTLLSLDTSITVPRDSLHLRLSLLSLVKCYLPSKFIHPTVSRTRGDGNASRGCVCFGVRPLQSNGFRIDLSPTIGRGESTRPSKWSSRERTLIEGVTRHAAPQWSPVLLFIVFPCSCASCSTLQLASPIGTMMSRGDGKQRP